MKEQDTLDRNYTSIYFITPFFISENLKETLPMEERDS